jgi:DNA-binding GntR family transcriptional regulator
MKQALYVQLAQKLKQAISSGRYPVGSLLPTELELSEIYSASRHTIRAAITELHALGLISRKKGVGTKVEALSPKRLYTQTIGSIEDLIAFSESYERSLVSSQKISATKKLATELKYNGRKDWIQLSYLRYTNTKSKLPLSITDNYVDAKFKDIANLVKKNPRTLISNLIEKKYGISIAEIKQEVVGITLTKNQAEILKSQKDAAGLKIIRTYIDRSNEVFEITITVCPADRHTVVSKLRRDTVT